MYSIKGGFSRRKSGAGNRESQSGSSPGNGQVWAHAPPQTIPAPCPRTCRPSPRPEAPACFSALLLDHDVHAITQGWESQYMQSEAPVHKGREAVRTSATWIALPRQAADALEHASHVGRTLPSWAGASHPTRTNRWLNTHALRAGGARGGAA